MSPGAAYATVNEPPPLSSQPTARGRPAATSAATAVEVMPADPFQVPLPRPTASMATSAAGDVPTSIVRPPRARSTRPLGSELNSASVLGDLLAVGTDLNLAGTVTLTLTDLSASTPITPGTILSLVNYGGSWNGGLLTYSGSALADEDLFTFGVNQFRIDYNSTTPGVNVTSPVGASYVNLVAVPEPTVSVALLSTLGLAALVLRRRRG